MATSKKTDLLPPAAESRPSADVAAGATADQEKAAGGLGCCFGGPARIDSCRPVRGEPVVQAVMSATLSELARVGYRALRVEDVAAVAGVNKTTVYRRWPTKPELVRDALQTLPERLGEPPDTGALRSDLIALAEHISRTMSSFEGAGLVRMMMVEHADPELASIVAGIREGKERVPLCILERAVTRHELPPHADPQMMLAVVVGTLHHHVFMKRETLDRAFIERLVDFVIAGATYSHAALPAVLPAASLPAAAPSQDAPSQDKGAQRPRRGLSTSRGRRNGR